jgi:hypothetical protein
VLVRISRARARGRIAAGAAALVELHRLREIGQGGLALLGVAGVSGRLALTMYSTDSVARDLDGESRYGAWKPVLAVTAAASGVVGLSLLVSSTRARGAPVVTSNAIGFAIIARL